jgi:hypothetical protein
LHRGLALLGRGEADLDLLGHDHGVTLPARAEVAGHRAEVAARPHEEGGTRRAVHDPVPPRALQALDPRAFLHLGAAAPEQIRVELTAQDPVAHRAAVFRLPRGAADHPGAEARDGLEHARPGVVVHIESERVHHSRRDPARADLVTGEHGLVPHDDVEAGGLEGPRHRGAGRPSPDHDGIGRAH